MIVAESTHRNDLNLWDYLVLSWLCRRAKTLRMILQNCAMNLTGQDWAKDLVQGVPCVTARCEHKS